MSEYSEYSGREPSHTVWELKVRFPAVYSENTQSAKLSSILQANYTDTQTGIGSQSSTVKDHKRRSARSLCLLSNVPLLRKCSRRR